MAMNFQGAYDAGTTYATGDVVTSAGSSYVSKVDANTGHTPASSPTQWDVLAARGATGSTGSTGATGAPGAPTTALSTSGLKDKLQAYYEFLGNDPAEREAMRGTLKVLIDLGFLTGVTADDVDAQHRILSTAQKQSG